MNNVCRCDRVCLLLSMPGTHHRAHLSECESSPKLITAHMQENISHDQCQSGGGKNKQSCFHSIHLTNMSATCVAELSLSDVTGAVTGWDSVQPIESSTTGERKRVFLLETAVPVFSRYTNTIGNLRNLQSSMLFLHSVRKRTSLT